MLEFQLETVVASGPRIMTALGLTIYIATVSMLSGLAVGLVVSLLRGSAFQPFRLMAVTYISIFRGLPLIAFLIWLYFGVTVAFNIQLSPITAGIVVLTIQSSAYLAEIYRSGMEAIPHTQRQAAVALGLSPVRVFTDVQFPQAVRIVLPAIGNEYIGLVKGSALVSILGVAELMRTSQQLVQFYQLPFEFFTTAAVLYVAVGVGLGRIFRIVEKRIRY